MNEILLLKVVTGTNLEHYAAAAGIHPVNCEPYMIKGVTLRAARWLGQDADRINQTPAGLEEYFTDRVERTLVAYEAICQAAREGEEALDNLERRLATRLYLLVLHQCAGMFVLSQRQRFALAHVRR